MLLVALGIVGLQVLVPAGRDAAVVGDPNAEGPGPALVVPTGSPTRPSRAPVTPTQARPTRAPVTATPPAATATPSATPAARPSLTVLNNSRVTGLAKKAASDFASGGWTIASTGNLSGRVAHTTVYYGPGQRDAAAALRRQFPAIAEAAPRYDGLPGGGGLTVVVTRDYPH